MSGEYWLALAILTDFHRYFVLIERDFDVGNTAGIELQYIDGVEFVTYPDSRLGSQMKLLPGIRWNLPRVWS
jgi:hypothetical protein